VGTVEGQRTVVEEEEIFDGEDEEVRRVMERQTEEM
jgi:hypothetical protein